MQTPGRPASGLREPIGPKDEDPRREMVALGFAWGSPGGGREGTGTVLPQSHALWYLVPMPLAQRSAYANLAVIQKPRPHGGRYFPSDKVLLFGYFLVLIVIGTVLFSLEHSWLGPPPDFLDILFTSVSAVCVTGLTTVPVSSMSLLGQTVLLFLIQLGGSGIITVTAMLFLLPRSHLTLKNRSLIKDFFVSSVDYKGSRILLKILTITFGVELVGFLLLLALTPRSEVSVFSALFHTVSAFNNAGFSLYDESLYAWRNHPVAVSFLSFLVITGGVGYVVLQEIGDLSASTRVRVGQRTLMAHSLLVLRMTVILLVAGWILTMASELGFGRASISDPEQWHNAWLHSVMTRTAGYNYLPTTNLSLPSQILSIPLMLIGAGPGSTAGGVKVTTFALFLVFLFQGHRPDLYARVGGEEVRNDTIRRATLLFTRFVIVYIFYAGVLVVTERWLHPERGLLPLMFEAASALGTVGLSLGITPDLTDMGKIVIIAAMFTGRVGLLAFIVWSPKDVAPRVRRPKAEVLLG